MDLCLDLEDVNWDDAFAGAADAVPDMQLTDADWEQAFEDDLKVDEDAHMEAHTAEDDFGTYIWALRHTDEYARERTNRVRSGTPEWSVPIGALKGRLGVEPIPPRLYCGSADADRPKAVGKEVYFHGKIGFLSKTSTRPADIRFHPTAAVTESHMFVLEDDSATVFENKSVFAAVPYAFIVGFYATPTGKRVACCGSTAATRSLYRVTRLLSKEAAADDALKAISHLVAHALRVPVNTVLIWLHKAGYDSEADKMVYPTEVESMLYCSGLVDMRQADHGFENATFLERYRLAVEAFGCTQWQQDNAKSAEYTARWYKAFYAVAPEMRNEATRKEIYALRDEFASAEAPLVVRIARHPECVAYFASPALAALAPLFGEDVLLGVGVEVLWCMLDDVANGGDADCAADMLRTAYGMCFRAEHSRTRCTVGKASHCVMDQHAFTLADVASFPTPYRSLHAPRMPLPLPEVSLVSLASAPKVCQEMGSNAFMRVMVYNLLKQATLEDGHSCITVRHMLERVAVEAFGHQPSEEYKRLRSSYNLARHKATESLKDALIASCAAGFGSERFTLLAQSGGHRRAVVLLAIAGLVRQRVIFLEQASVTELYARRERDPKERVLETVPLDDDDVYSVAAPGDSEDILGVERQLRDRLVATKWKPRMNFRLYLPDLYFQEEMVVQALAQHSSAQRAFASTRRVSRNPFYKRAVAEKWSDEEIREKAAATNAILDNMEVAIADAVEGNCLNDEIFALAEQCEQAGMDKVHVSPHALSLDQRLAMAAVDGTKGGVTVLQGAAGSGKTEVAQALRNRVCGTEFLGCAFMNAQCANLHRALGGGDDSNVLTTDRLALVHDALCRNPYMRDCLEETAAYKKGALQDLSVFGFLKNLKSYNMCPLEGVRTLFVDEFTALPLEVAAVVLYVTVQCAKKLRNIVLAGDFNQVWSIAPSPLALALPIGLGYAAHADRWRASDAITMHNSDAILAGNAGALMLLERGESDAYPIEGATEANAPAVLIPCHPSWKEAYYGDYPSCVVRLMVKDFEAGLIPPDDTIVVAPSNELATVINQHLGTAHLRMLARSADPVVSARAKDDLVRFNITPERREKNDTILRKKGCIYRGQVVVATTSMEAIGVPNKMQFVVGDDLHVLVHHIRYTDVAALQERFFAAVCESVIELAESGAAETDTTFALFVDALTKGKAPPLYNGIVYSRAAKYSRTVIEEDARAQRLQAEAVLKMVSSGLKEREVLRYLTCGGSGAGRVHHPAVASDQHVAGDTVDQSLCLHSVAAAAWKYSGAQPPVVPERTEALTTWLQTRASVQKCIDDWIAKDREGREPLRESAEPLFKRAIKRAARILACELESAEGDALARELEHDIANSLVTDRQCMACPPQAALRIALEELHMAEQGAPNAVHPSDYILAVPVGTRVDKGETRRLHFKKLYEVSTRDGALGRLVYYPAGAAMMEKLAPALATTCHSAQSQSKRVVAVAMPASKDRNWLFTAGSRCSEKMRLYSSRGTIERTVAASPTVRYSALSAKLALAVRIPYLEEESRDGAPRTRLRKLCTTLEKEHRARMQVEVMEGEDKAAAVLRLSRHVRKAPFVEPAEMPLPGTLSDNDRWLVDEMAANGDVLFRPNGLPCGVAGVTADVARDDARWTTEEGPGCRWSAIKAKPNMQLPMASMYVKG